MTKKILFAGAAGALLLGSVAIAQTANDASAQGSTANDATTAGAYQADSAQRGEATSASEFGSDTAEGTAMDRAGERG